MRWSIRYQLLIPLLTLLLGVVGVSTWTAVVSAHRAVEQQIEAHVREAAQVLNRSNVPLIDEAFHWHRYVRKHSDRVEMWSHVGIFVGHGTMMLGWWAWYFQGYGGVAETVAALGL